MEKIKTVCYEDFGAIGDGVTDDSEAMRKCHEYANENGCKVLATEGKTYYIGPMPSHIVVKTDVDFRGANFIIDDSKISPDDKVGETFLRGVSVFYLAKDNEEQTFTPENSEVLAKINAEGGFKRDSFKKLDLGIGHPALLIVKNGEHRNYIRFGVNASSGAIQSEIVLVDENGNIDENTPFMFDYEKITLVIAYRIDDKPITIENGTFTTIANCAPSKYTAYGRGIDVRRSNVTLKNVKHYITGEGETGAPYGGFNTITGANNVTFDSCVYTAHKTYYQIKKNEKGEETHVGNGTYDIGMSNSANILWKNCDQSNFFEAGTKKQRAGYWGVMGSSFSKNVGYVGCTLSRFDAHAGIWNAYIIDSEISMLRITGGGTFTLKNTEVYSNSNLLVGLREDYGGFWHGDVVIDNVTFHNDNEVINIMSNTWYNHDFGYHTALPKNITVSDFKVMKNDGTESEANVHIFGERFVEQTKLIVLDEIETTNYQTGEKYMKKNINKTSAPKTITVKNNTQGLTYVTPDSPFFDSTKIVIE